MKLRVLTILIFTFSLTSIAQVGIGTANPNAKAELEISSTNKGLLIPRMTAAQRIAIAGLGAPEAGLLVYQTDLPIGLWYWSGTAWVQNSLPSWNLNGNGGITSADYLGTSDAQPLIFRTDGLERMRISGSGATAGFVGIGTNAPTARLHIVGGVAQTIGFESLAITPLTNGIITGGAWTTTTAAGEFNVGISGARSGTGVNFGVSEMTYAATIGPSGGNIAFDFRVGSETGFDFFDFAVDGVNQIIQTGTVPWNTFSLPLSAGPHTFVWRYRKDGSVNVAPDRAFVDNIIISNTSPVLRIVDGFQAAGRVLTSDATGVAQWAPVSVPSGTNWLTGGNSGTTPGTNFVGTTDAQDFVMRANGVERVRVLVNGNVGIGVVAPTAKLDVSENQVNQAIIRGINTNISAPSVSTGILGQAFSTQLGSAGVVGSSLNSGNNEIGVLGEYALWGAAVMGVGDGGTVNDLVAFRDYGVYGSVGVNFGTGVYGKNLDTTVGTAYGMYCNGNFAVTGAKSASVPTTQGNQLVYCTESPELWFEDLGFGELKNGSLHVTLDAMFQETVYIDNTHKMHVFVQEEGDSNGLFVKMDVDNKGFTVKEKNNGRSNNSFSYRILAKRRFYQNQRFGVDANQPFENNLIKHKDVPITTTDPQVMKQLSEQSIAKKNMKQIENK